MAKAARKAGKGIAVRSAYRSYSSQQSVFQGWVNSSGYQQALKFSARPGHSEHQLGTTIDFRSASSQTGTLGLQRLGDQQAGGLDEAERLEVRLRDELPQGQVQQGLLRL